MPAAFHEQQAGSDVSSRAVRRVSRSRGQPDRFLLPSNDHGFRQKILQYCQKDPNNSSSSSSGSSSSGSSSSSSTHRETSHSSMRYKNHSPSPTPVIPSHATQPISRLSKLLERTDQLAVSPRARHPPCLRVCSCHSSALLRRSALWPSLL